MKIENTKFDNRPCNTILMYNNSKANRKKRLSVVKVDEIYFLQIKDVKVHSKFQIAS